MKRSMQHHPTKFPATGRARSGQGGFSLLEVVASVAIFLVATSAMYGLLLVADRSRTAVNQRAELLKNIRAAMTIVGRDAYNAGYKYPVSSVLLPDNKVSALLGVPGDVDASRDLMPPVIAGNSINPNDLSGVNTDQFSFVFQDPAFNVDANNVSQPLLVNAPTFNTASGLDEIVPISGDASSCRAKDIMVITGRTSATVGVVTNINGSAVQFGSGDVLGFNSPAAIDNPMRNIQAPTTMRRASLITYRVLRDGALVRTVYANDVNRTVSSPSVDNPLVYGVEAMTVEYVLNNGTVTRNPLAGPDGVQGNGDDQPANQNLVRQVRVTLTVRSSEKDPAGNYFKVTMTTTFDTRNLGYDAS